MTTRLQNASAQILQTFGDGPRVLTLADIQQIFRDNREAWQLPRRLTQQEFIEFLSDDGQLKSYHLKFPHRPYLRYTWGEADLADVVQSVNLRGYFSHFTALQHHSLTEQLPKTIYFNIEQRLTGGGTEPSQRGIDHAFQRKCRVSQNLVTLDNWTIRLLNGRNTGELGVVQTERDGVSSLRYTDIERTLIDVTVRPVYSGGPFQVAEAFEAAEPRLNVKRLIEYLRKLNYTYPFHQAIGYYMDRSGKYSADQLALLRDFEMRYDFYLDYGLKQTDYIKDWRLHVPKGF